jgi:hypothetical protein
MDDVRVHYNSAKPAQLQALAYTQGTDIHVAPGQEKHLPHEAWHVVQQKQGRVQPTMQLQGVNINDNEGLEKEADVKSSELKIRESDLFVQLKKRYQCKCFHHAYNTVQMLSKPQRSMITKYSITSKFEEKHIRKDASRRDQIGVAEMRGMRGIRISTIITKPKKELEDMALGICKTGDNIQVAARQNGDKRQIHVRLTGITHRTITGGVFGEPSTDAFQIIGDWRNDKQVEGNHFEANSQLPANDEEVIPS